MKINMKHEEPKRIYFDDVKEGEIFIRDGGEVWMKVPLVAEEAEDEADYYNALSMETSEFEEICGYEYVTIPKIAELNIEY